MYFLNRVDAAMQLSKKLDKYRGQKGVILAVPRGGVPIGYYLARYLDFELDLLMTKKLRHPLNEEFAIGAVGLEDSIIEETENVPTAYIKEKVTEIHEQLKKRYKDFMGEKEPLDLQGKIVIVVDDGIATGRTILATLKMLRSKHPKKLVVAVPIASTQAAERVAKEVDEFISIHNPVPFFGVGRFYQDFSQTTDEEVINFLKELNFKPMKSAD